MRYRNTDATDSLMPRKRDKVLDRWCQESSVVESLVRAMPLCSKADEASYAETIRRHLAKSGPAGLCDLADASGRTLLWHATRELDDKAVRLLLVEGNMSNTISPSHRTHSKVDPVSLALELGRDDLAEAMVASASAMVVRRGGSYDADAAGDRDAARRPQDAGASFFLCCAPSADEAAFVPCMGIGEDEEF